MEVGAVKQAFNNEVILLKKKLNQAKINTINKLTRKAKTLVEKKSPEHLKEKLKRKAESAVSEVLIIKKIKARDIAKFIITHTGNVKDYINRPKVDSDKACARLVLHRALQDKYKFIRNRFGNVPIKDLFMSRQERRKLKKEAQEQQKNKKKGGKDANGAGDWDVEDVVMGDDSKDIGDSNSDYDIDECNNSEADSGDDNESEVDLYNVKTGNKSHQSILSDNDDEVGNNKSDEDDNDNGNEYSNDNENASDSNNEEEVGKFIKIKPQPEKPSVEKTKPLKTKATTTTVDTFKLQTNKIEKKQTDKKAKDNKNKNLKEKLQKRNFKKDEDDAHTEGNKVVDPFFKTATGENYMSVAEPRAPDEIKEVHKQGNRQMRRAAMFGHVAKVKPRRDNFNQNNFRTNKFEKQNGNDGNTFRNRNDKFNNVSNYNDKSAKFDDRNKIFSKNDSFNDRKSNFNDRNTKFSDRNSNSNSNKFDNKSGFNNHDSKKEEKLHPSWEAKRKLKSMSLLPAQGKKIVFE